MRQQRTCFVNLGGKARTCLGKWPHLHSCTHLCLSDSPTAQRDSPVLPESEAQSTQGKQIKGMFSYFFCIIQTFELLKLGNYNCIHSTKTTEGYVVLAAAS